MLLGRRRRGVGRFSRPDAPEGAKELRDGGNIDENRWRSALSPYLVVYLSAVLYQPVLALQLVDHGGRHDRGRPVKDEHIQELYVVYCSNVLFFLPSQSRAF